MKLLAKNFKAPPAKKMIRKMHTKYGAAISTNVNFTKWWKLNRWNRLRWRVFSLQTVDTVLVRIGGCEYFPRQRNRNVIYMQSLENNVMHIRIDEAHLWIKEEFCCFIFSLRLFSLIAMTDLHRIKNQHRESEYLCLFPCLFAWANYTTRRCASNWQINSLAQRNCISIYNDPELKLNW